MDGRDWERQKERGETEWDMTELYLTADILPQFSVSNSNSNSSEKYETKIKLNKMKQNETKQN